MANTKKSGASYTAELVDKISKPIDNIIKSLGRLEEALNDIKKPAGDVGRAMQQAFPRRQLKIAESTNKFTKLNAAMNTIAVAGTAVATVMKAIGRVVALATRAVIEFTSALVRMVVAGLKSSIIEASNLIETINAFEATFKTQAANARKFFQDMGQAAGRASNDILKAATSFQGLFVGLGASSGEAAGLSKALTSLSLDFASFFNIQDSDAQRRFIAALAGSTEVLDRFGINIRENQAELKASELGFGNNIRKLTEYQKALVRTAIIVETMGRQGAIGDVIKTSMEWANQIKSLRSGLREIGVAIGQIGIDKLRPLLQALVKLTWAVANNFKAIVGAMKGLAPVEGVLKNITQWVQGLADAIAKQDFEAFGRILKLTMKLAFLDIQLMFQALLKNMIVMWGNNTLKIAKMQAALLVDLATNPTRAVANIAASLKNALTMGSRTREARAETSQELKMLLAGLAKGNPNQRPGFDSDAAKRFVDFAVFMEQLRSRAKGLWKALQEWEAELNKSAAEMTERFKSPLQKFRDEVSKIEMLFGAGKISNETRSRAMLAAAQTFQSTQRTQQAMAMQGVSRGSFSSNVARNAGSFMAQMDPLVQETKTQTKLLGTIAKNTKVNPNTLDQMVFQ